MVAALDEDDVVIAQGVRRHDEILAVDLLDEWLVAADIVDVIEIAELLQQRQRIGAAPEPVAVVAERTLAGGRFDHVAGRDQKRPLFLTTHRVLRAPARAMAGPPRDRARRFPWQARDGGERPRRPCAR